MTILSEVCLTLGLLDGLEPELAYLSEMESVILLLAEPKWSRVSFTLLLMVSSTSVCWGLMLGSSARMHIFLRVREVTIL